MSCKDCHLSEKRMLTVNVDSFTSRSSNMSEINQHTVDGQNPALVDEQKILHQLGLKSIVISRIFTSFPVPSLPIIHFIFFVTLQETSQTSRLSPFWSRRIFC